MIRLMTMSRAGDLYQNFNFIDSKCAELISQIDDHLSVSDGRRLITRNEFKRSSTLKSVNAMFLSCHRKIVDYSTVRKTSAARVENLEKANVPLLHIAKEFCEKLTKINRPFPEEIFVGFRIKSEMQPSSANRRVKFVKPAPPTKVTPSLKRQVAFNLNVKNDDYNEGIGLRKSENVGVLNCSHSPSTQCQNRHKYLASTKDTHAHVEPTMIDFGPHVRNSDERPNGDSTASNNVRAFLFGSSKNDGKLPKAVKSVIVSVKTKKDFRKKKFFKRRGEKFKTDTTVPQPKNKKQVLFKTNKSVPENVTMKKRQTQDDNDLPNEKLMKNNVPAQYQNKISTVANAEVKLIPGHIRSHEDENSAMQLQMDKDAERKLASQLLIDSMKLCLKNTSKKEKRITFSLPHKM